MYIYIYIYIDHAPRGNIAMASILVNGKPVQLPAITFGPCRGKKDKYTSRHVSVSFRFMRNVQTHNLETVCIAAHRHMIQASHARARTHTRTHTCRQVLQCPHKCVSIRINIDVHKPSHTCTNTNLQIHENIQLESKPHPRNGVGLSACRCPRTVCPSSHTR
jgi:hypothetical protein